LKVMIMKLVGANNRFIRAPFLLEGIFYALASIAILIAIVYPIINFIQPSLTSYFQDADVINLQQYFRYNFWYIFGSQFLVLAIVNILSTTIAIRKYLRV